MTKREMGTTDTEAATGKGREGRRGGDCYKRKKEENTQHDGEGERCRERKSASERVARRRGGEKRQWVIVEEERKKKKGKEKRREKKGEGGRRKERNGKEGREERSGLRTEKRS